MPQQKCDVEKIHQMLMSEDKEMVILGAIVAFDQGNEWIMKNIPYFGPAVPSSGKRALIACHRDNPFMVVKNKIGIRIGSTIDARHLFDFPTSMKDIEAIHI